MRCYEEILGYLETLPVINTHSHHLRHRQFFDYHPNFTYTGQYDLNALLHMSYCAWCGPLPGEDGYFSKVKNRGPFRALERGLQALYGIDAPLNEETYPLFDAAIRAAYPNGEDRTFSLLREKCGYEKIVLDAPLTPGDTYGEPDLFAGVIRLDYFLQGYADDTAELNGLNCRTFHGRENFLTLQDFCDTFRRVVAEKKKNGLKAIKCAAAYERGLDFAVVSKERAEKVFTEKDPAAQQIRDFQDYFFHFALEVAREFELPVQIHTGLGGMVKSNPHMLQPVIASHRENKFVLFHGGYPWTDEWLGLLQAYPGTVYGDTVWLPVLSETAAERVLCEVMDIANADAVTWGCDTWTGEESYGSLLAMRRVLARALARKVQENYFSLADAFEAGKNILYTGAKKLYQL
jgi:hypothetical protein